MLLATQSQSVTGTQKYFETVLTQGDYYLGQEVSGHWWGEGAEILGLVQGSAVTKEQFTELLKGYHPTTREKLTQRIRKDRRPGTDLTFSVPKSVSLAWAINGDERILEALRLSVQETMARDIEPLMQRRVRKGKFANSKERADTGKLIYADFLHKTSRPVDGVPDPHLHVHAFVMNWTEHEGKHYAGEMEEIVRQRPSLQAKFHARLARNLEALGYRVEQVQFLQSGRMKQGWELEGIGRATIEKFSRRTEQIEKHAEEQGITKADVKGKLGKLTREQKDKGKTTDKLRSEWLSRLTREERAAIAKLKRQSRGEQQTEGSRTPSRPVDHELGRELKTKAKQAVRREEGTASPQPSQESQAERDKALASVRFALDHHLYRQSTVERHQLTATALEHGITLRPETIDRAIDRMGLIERQVRSSGGMKTLVTTRSVLKAEQELIRFARDGRGTRKALRTEEYQFKRDWLSEQQQAAVRCVLHSRDTVMAIVGGAGTGKTSLMKEARDGVQRAGKKVFTFAPSTGATEVLRGEGFTNASTVEHLIRNSKKHKEVKNQVIWIDEAGLVDVRSMNAVFKIAKEQNVRVVLSGDPKQHASPRRGEAMRLLEQEAGLDVARTQQIQRQRGKYRRAVEFVSKGMDVVDPRAGKTGLLMGFEMLESMGKIKEISSGDRHVQLAESYLGTRGKGKSALVVAPTHAEAQAVTAEIRSQLQAKDQLSKEEQSFIQYRPLNLSEAEKGEARSYAMQQGLVVQFHQNTKGGINRGDRFRVTGARGGRVYLQSITGSTSKCLPLDQPDRFEVYAESQVQIAKGDKLRFCLGGTTRDGKGRISNGRLDEVKGFDATGNLILKNGWVVNKDYAHLDHGYVVTSHASQGKDRDVAIGAMGSESLPAINARQFYVTVSRGKEDVVLYVDDKEKIKDAIQRSGKQMSATEMIEAGRSHEHRQSHERKFTFRDRLLKWWQGLNREKPRSEPSVGRHRQAGNEQNQGLGRGFDSGMGMNPNLGPGRSRG